MLDIRREHIKFWRPQILLMVSNPRCCCPLLDFINDMKKGGLYVLGHVQIGHLDDQDVDPCQTQYPAWLKLVDTLRIKAFVEVTLASSVQEGLQHLIRLSGLGGMKPNTICFGFYDDAVQLDSYTDQIVRHKRHFRFYSQNDNEDDIMQEIFPPRHNGKLKLLNEDEYVHMLRDVFKMKKNVCLFRHFHRLNKLNIFKSKSNFIDVWPMNLFKPDSVNYFDNTCLFMLQLACILHMVPKWKSSTILRIFMCVASCTEDTNTKERKLSEILRQLRIPAIIEPVHIETAGMTPYDQASGRTRMDDFLQGGALDNEYLLMLNSLIKMHSQHAAVVFCYLPRLPFIGPLPAWYLPQLDTLTSDLPPTVLVHGTHPVTSTTL